MKTLIIIIDRIRIPSAWVWAEMSEWIEEGDGDAVPVQWWMMIMFIYKLNNICALLIPLKYLLQAII